MTNRAISADTSAPTTTSSWPHPDSAQRYGSLSRLLHWAMAACFAAVFAAAIAHYLDSKSAASDLLWPLHKPLGALLMLLVVLRSAWALLQARRRPAPINRAAPWGHRALYLLMYAVPVIALLRQYGSGRVFAPFGLPLMDARADDKIDWMVELGGLLHGELGWALLAAVVGHIAMALWHRRGAHDALARMAG